ncbi:Tn3 family transposase [Nocardia niwae]|uniref:Tn3 family transposase n=1 Tax=Nocardia niwae TaxID=626084 RepID=UPI0012F4CA6F
MAVESSSVDTHGRSEIGFGGTELPGFDLLPRIQRINKMKPYRPVTGRRGSARPGRRAGGGSPGPDTGCSGSPAGTRA